MLNKNLRLQPRDEDVAAKVIDGEAIIINLANGTYYSMDNAGGLVWEMIQRGNTTAEVAAALADHYGLSLQRAWNDLDAVVAELLRENLVVSTATGDASAAAEAVDRRTDTAPYEPPTLKIYRDMGDLLALDPPTPGLDRPWNDGDTVGAAASRD